MPLPPSAPWRQVMTALAETMNGLFKTELLRNPAALEANGGPWKGLTDLEVAICAWVQWFKERRLRGELT